MIARFTVPMLLLLAALAWGTAEFVELTALRWFEQDRAALAMQGATNVELAAAEDAGRERAALLHRAALALFAVQGLLTMACLFAAKVFLWRRWTRRVHDLMASHEPADRYTPVLRDLRDRVDRMARQDAEDAEAVDPDAADSPSLPA